MSTPVRSAIASLLFLAIGCGSAPPPTARAVRRAPRAPLSAAVPLSLEVGDAFEAVHREVITLSGTEVLERETRLSIYVVDVRGSDRFDLRVRMMREGAAGARVATDVRVTVGPDGAPMGSPRSVCFDDDLEHGLVRIVRHVLANRPGSSTYLGYESELRDLRIAVETREARDGSRLVRGTTRLDFFDVGDVRVEGPLEVRARVHTEPRSLAATMHAESRGDVEATHRESGRRTTETFVATSDVQIRAVADAVAPPECRLPAFDPQIVVRAIDARRLEIQRCYERELRRAPELQGRVMVRMTIETDGRVTDVTASEVTPAGGSPPLDPIAACVVDVLASLHFDPGPIDGSVTYSFPFVFEPQP